MEKRKSWFLILGMTMLLSWGTMTAQAAPQGHPSDHQLPGYSRVAPHHAQMDFKPNQQEYQEIMSVLRIDHGTFERELKRGKSLAEIAVHQDVKVKKVIRLIAKQMKNHIDQDKRDHRITAEQAAYMKDQVQEYAKEVVNEKWLNYKQEPIRPHRFMR